MNDSESSNTDPGTREHAPIEGGLTPPETTLETLSFTATNTPALRQWVSSLPLVNTKETAVQLRMATRELALLDAPYPQKLDYLEAVRPVVHYVGSRLDQLNLNRVKKDDDSLAYDLFTNLYQGYKGALLDALMEDKPANKELTPLLLHRLITDLSRILLRSMQFYREPPAQLWRELNTCYRVAAYRRLLDAVFADDLNNSASKLTIRNCYMRTLLLSSARPNQLSPAQLGALFGALEHWCSKASLDKEIDNAMLIVDMARPSPPRLARLVKQAEEPYAVRTDVLAYEIDAYLNGIDGSLVIPAAIDNDLLKHLMVAWSVARDRQFSRTKTQASIRVCVGLRSIHYFLSGATEFTEQISNGAALLRREVNPFLELDYETTPPQQEAPNSHAHFEAQAIDTSPEGYRIEWREPLPDNAQIGELIALREESDPRWSVAVVRWIHHARSPNDAAQDSAAMAHITMGLKLLCPRAIPVAVRAIQKVGGPTAYARALLLPELTAIGQSPTLVTPNVPFTTGQKVQVHRQGLQTTAALLDSRVVTESVSQFTFRMLDGYLENVRSSSNIGGLSAMNREDTTQGP